MLYDCMRNRVLFQSTLPAREATILLAVERINSTISIHASREGSDSSPTARSSSTRHFNPRFPRGKRPPFLNEKSQAQNISIHASREGSDRHDRLKSLLFDISIHASREGSDL